MTSFGEAVQALRIRPGETTVAWVRNSGWILGLLFFLALLFVFTVFIQPTYGVRGIQGLAISVLPLAFAAVGQAIVVISGGIDLSIGSMMALTSVVAARFMAEQPEMALVVVMGVLLLGLLLGMINGVLVVTTRVPDIVVTLAMLFVWSGFALVVMQTPGGTAAPWLRDLIRGDFLIEWIPRALVFLLVVVGLIWLPIRRSRLGLSLYAVGSNSLAAFRSGISIRRTKIMAYTLTGLFASIAGLTLTASTGIGTPVPGPYTLLSVAAVVLGGVSLAGGRGGVLGPIIGVVILSQLRTIMTFMRLDPNLAVVAQGAILIGVVMAGSLMAIRRMRK
jgi:ribose transport system permease protein